MLWILNFYKMHIFEVILLLFVENKSYGKTKLESKEQCYRETKLESYKQTREQSYRETSKKVTNKLENKVTEEQS